MSGALRMDSNAYRFYESQRIRICLCEGPSELPSNQSRVSRAPRLPLRIRSSTSCAPTMLHPSRSSCASASIPWCWPSSASLRRATGIRHRCTQRFEAPMHPHLRRPPTRARSVVRRRSDIGSGTKTEWDRRRAEDDAPCIVITGGGCCNSFTASGRSCGFGCRYAVLVLVHVPSKSNTARLAVATVPVSGIGNTVAWTRRSSTADDSQLLVWLRVQIRKPVIGETAAGEGGGGVGGGAVNGAYAAARNRESSCSLKPSRRV
ncbi:hypothetical protein B0H12DRAFT_298345 [Mycena haematopus]|nr:hypothetical protein B0H12DRAFT_298345 [Mycena haematopus]